MATQSRKQKISDSFMGQRVQIFVTDSENDLKKIAREMLRVQRYILDF